MSLLKKAALVLTLAFSTAAAAQGDLNNPANPNSPLNPLNPTGIYADDGKPSAPSQPLDIPREDWIVLGIIAASALGIGAASLIKKKKKSADPEA